MEIAVKKPICPKDPSVAVTPKEGQYTVIKIKKLQALIIWWKGWGQTLVCLKIDTHHNQSLLTQEV